MGKNREFEIAFVGLKPGAHEFEYLIKDSFFESYGEQDFINCKANVKLNLDRKKGFMQLHFDIAGTVDLDCDRCGNTVNKELWDEYDMIVKLVEEPQVMNDQEEDPDVYYIGLGESHLHLSDWIYEFVCLSIPLQRVCKIDEEGKSLCNPEVIAKLKKMEEEINKQNNPLWKGLENLKDLNN